MIYKYFLLVCDSSLLSPSFYVRPSFLPSFLVLGLRLGVVSAKQVGYHYITPQLSWYFCKKKSFSFSFLVLRIGFQPFLKFFILRQGLVKLLNCPEKSWDFEPPASAYQSAGITRVYHPTLLKTSLWPSPGYWFSLVGCTLGLSLPVPWVCSVFQFHTHGSYRLGPICCVWCSKISPNWVTTCRWRDCPFPLVLLSRTNWP